MDDTRHQATSAFNYLVELESGTPMKMSLCTMNDLEMALVIAKQKARDPFDHLAERGFELCRERIAAGARGDTAELQRLDAQMDDLMKQSEIRSCTAGVKELEAELSARRCTTPDIDRVHRP
jgi:hypothetical protein